MPSFRRLPHGRATRSPWWTSQWAHLAEPVTGIAPGSTGNVTIYAKWTANTYTITYVTDPMAIEDLEPVSYTYGTGVAELPVPESSNPYLKFDGWYEDSVKVTSISATAVGDKTLTARWIEDTTKMTSVTFVGAEGAQTESCRILTTDVTALETGWYVVNDDLEFEGNGISVSGDVKLVIEDGKTMTVTVTRNPSQHAGINVPEGSSLAIYGQAGGTGTLVVSGGNTGGAAIGGNNNEKCGAVSVYGGRVAATGGDWGAGIGGGGHADGGAIAIYGGDVNAMGGVSAAGIGGGYEGNGGTVGIYGGVVRASSDSLNCGGIGKGLSGGAYSEIGEVELTVGENVYVQVRRPAGYADWFYVNRETGAVQISSVKPHYLVFDATTTAFPIVYMDGETELTGLLPTVYYYDVGVEDGLPVPEAPEGYAFAGWFDNPDLEGDPIDAISEREAGEITLWAKWHKLETVTYIDQYGVGHNKECRVFDPGTTQLWDGEWYVVKEDIKIEGGIAVLGSRDCCHAR